MAAALVIVDFQNDFTAGGALAVTDGDAIADPINELIDGGEFELVIATRDWHPPDHESFAIHGGTWPVHCVAGSHGAELHPSLRSERIDLIVDKGQDSATDGYSAFEDTELEPMLRARGIDELMICGLATDYCVKRTALDALSAGFAVRIDSRCVRGVDTQPGDSDRTLAELREAGATILCRQT
jgi:nicotinamidase/pyrazinamidase